MATDTELSWKAVCRKEGVVFFLLVKVLKNIIMSKKKIANEQIQVFIRCRPLLKSELNVPTPVEVHPEVNKILIRDLGADKCTVKSFTFDKVFGPEAKQTDIYAGVVAPVIEEVMMGFNCTILAYGQTGTGKTFTIEGGRSTNPQDKADDPLSGIIPRAMRHLFHDLTAQETKFEICVSFLELYNEKVFDLLSKTDDLVKLKMFDNSSQKGSVIVQGLQVIPVTSMQEVYAILDKGCKKRRKAATLLNKMSSRSHTVFTVTVNIKETSSTLCRIRAGKLNLVDLAGSENIGRSGAIDKRAREAGSINQSLLALGRVITSLCDNAVHVPYRESKLTLLLRDSLGGQTKTTIIATISSSALHIDETLNTLEYALRAKNITNKPELNTQVALTSLMKDYMDEIIRLRKTINDLGRERGFYVSEENLRHYETSLASRKEEKSKILYDIEDLIEENKSLDAAIFEAENLVAAKRQTLKDRRKFNDDLKAEIEREEEECKLHETMVSLMVPLCDNLHDKLHKRLEKHSELECEVMQVKTKAKKAGEERQKLHEKVQNLRQNYNHSIEQFRRSIEDLSKNVKNMHDRVKSLGTECDAYVVMLKNGFESTFGICENKFVIISKAMNDVEIAHIFFQGKIGSILNDQRSSTVKWMDEFQANYAERNKHCILEPLTTALDDCETSLISISTAFKNWKNELESKIKLQNNVLQEHLNIQKSTMESAVLCMNNALGLTKSVDGFNNTVLEFVNSQIANKKLWDKKFQSVEQAVSSLDLFCTEIIEQEVDKATQTKSLLRNCSSLGREITTTTMAYCDNFYKNIDGLQKEADTLLQDTFSGKWKEMKESLNSSCEKYHDLKYALDICTKAFQNHDWFKNGSEVATVDEFEPKVAECIEKMTESLSKFGSLFKRAVSENQQNVDIFLSTERIPSDKLKETSKELSKIIENEISEYNACIETNILKPLTDVGLPENIANKTDNEMKNTEETLPDQDKTFTSLEQSEEYRRALECCLCLDTSAENTPQADEHGCIPSVFCSSEASRNPSKLANASESRSFMSHIQKSPIRRPVTFSARKNLQFPDLEMLSQQLLENLSSEEEN